MQIHLPVVLFALLCLGLYRVSAEGALALCGDDRYDPHNAATPATCKEAEGVTVWPLQGDSHAVRLVTGEDACSSPCELHGHDKCHRYAAD